MLGPEFAKNKSLVTATSVSAMGISQHRLSQLSLTCWGLCGVQPMQGALEAVGGCLVCCAGPVAEKAESVARLI